jgi:hypothetical protein
LPEKGGAYAQPGLGDGMKLDLGSWRGREVAGRELEEGPVMGMGVVTDETGTTGDDNMLRIIIVFSLFTRQRTGLPWNVWDGRASAAFIHISSLSMVMNHVSPISLRMLTT